VIYCEIDAVVSFFERIIYLFCFLTFISSCVFFKDIRKRMFLNKIKLLKMLFNDLFIVEHKVNITLFNHKLQSIKSNLLSGNIPNRSML
jgi:hypothetical protein